MRDNFYREWAKYRSENEYLALDITSISTYSGNIDDAEYGINKDGDHLKQINMCLLIGGESQIPIYQTAYSGRIKDIPH
ncbi:MAG: hypothetical protein LBF68_04860 [Christensenellaceae bacterium]|jgi:transposase|nr:hypothetical protein [Christensenellaceae bacterium]